MQTRMLLTLACVAAALACGDEEGGLGGSTGNDSVRVVNNSFNPVTVTADSTGTVVWTWSSGGETHNVTFQDAITGSGDKTTGTFSHTFGADGTYRYRCTHHSSSFTSGMAGVVLVGAPADTADPPDPY
jgi:plastocyanin